MLKRLFFLFLPLFLIANDLRDDDFDGVPNYLDKCPNSSFEDIVDKNGCKKEKITFLNDNTNSFLTLSFGINYYKTKQKSFTNKSFSISYLFNDYTIYFNYDNASLVNKTLSSNDITLAIYKNFYKDNFFSTIGGGIYLPTKNRASNKSDYFFYLKGGYFKKNYQLSLFVQYSITRDKDALNNYFLGVEAGLNINEQNYLSLLLTWQRRVYKDEKNSFLLSLSYSYKFNQHWSIDLNFDKSLTLAKNQGVSFYLNYTF